MFQESLTYKFIAAIAAFLVNSWNDSFISAAAQKSSKALKSAISGSRIVTVASREGFLVSAWENSQAAKLLTGIFNLPSRLHDNSTEIKGSSGSSVKGSTDRNAGATGAVLAESLAYRIIAALTGKLHILSAVFLFIALVIPHTRWNNMYAMVAAVALFILYIFRMITTGESRFGKRTISVYMAIYMLCIVLSVIFSILPKSSLRYFAFFLTCFIFMLLMVLSVRNKRELGHVISILLAGLALSGLYGVYQYLAGIPVDPTLTDTTLNEVTFGRAYSSFGNPNNFAEILVMLLPFYLAAFINSKGLLKKLLFTAMFIPPMASLLLTLSRSGWIGFAVAVVVFLFFVKKWLIPLLLVLAVVVFPFLPMPLYRRILTITNPADTSVSTRFLEYQTIMPMLDKFWFTGLGLGNETFTSVIRNFYIYVKGGKILQHSHNLYLQIWLETGIIGILSFLAFLLNLFKNSVRSLWSSGDKQLKTIIAAAMSSLSGVLVIGLAEYVWFYPRVMLVFWTVVGILLCSINLMREGA